MDILSTVAWISKSFLLINIIALVAVILLTLRLSKPIGLLLALLVGMLFIELLLEYFANRQIPNIHLTHYYSIGQFLILSLIYSTHLKKFQIAVPIGVALFSVVFIYQLLAGKIVYDQFNAAGFLISACILMFYAFFYYIEHIAEKKYWDTFNVGLFLYLGGSSIIFLTMNSWEDLEHWNTIIWTLNASLSVLFQLFICITIYRYYRILKTENGISSL